jgi:hypothetical protein
VANDAKKVSELAVTTTLSANDRVVILSNPSSAANTKTITVANFANNVTANNANYLGGIISTSYVNTTGAYTISGVHTHSANLLVTTNTFNLGTNINGANGYTYLPNGFKLNWGWVSANSTTGNVTFSSAYTTNAYCVVATSNTSTATYQTSVISTNNTVAAIRTANATVTNVFWQAIGY